MHLIDLAAVDDCVWYCRQDTTKSEFIGNVNNTFVTEQIIFKN